jgi:uncharacterized protein (TIGR03435 family)
MKSDERGLKELVDRSIPTPSTREMESRCDRVLETLQSGNLATSERTTFQPEPIHSRQTPWRVAVICAAVAAAFVVAVSPTIWKTPDVKAVKAVKAVKPAPQTATGDSSTTTSTIRTLADGSRIEMRAGAEAVVENVPDGLMIRLNSGSMMVFAAKQAVGRHLYVQTRDLKVSVVGTVFVVKADDNGSRVAVIEGEVRVQQGAVDTNLRPGEQFPFNPKSEDLKFFRETGWSREAFAYLSKLHESMGQSLAARQSSRPTPTVSDKAKFEEASIRLCEQDIQAPEGARGGGSGSIRISPGRVEALCLTVPTLITIAHRSLNNHKTTGDLRMNRTSGLPPEDGTRVKGGPDWVRSEKYTIAAIGDSTDLPTLQRPMLLDLLERRFKLKLRIETEEIPVYELTIAKSGLKTKPIDPGPEWYARLHAIQGTPSAPRQTPPKPEELNEFNELLKLMGCYPAEAAQNDPAQRNRSREAVRRGEQPPSCGNSFDWNGPNMVLNFGGSGISSLARQLSGARSLPDTLSGLLVLDKTGLPNADCFLASPPAGTRCAPLFNFVLEYAADESYFTVLERDGALTPRDLADLKSVPKAPNIFDALEKLGLHLEKSKASREYIVIEHIERPSPN